MSTDTNSKPPVNTATVAGTKPSAVVPPVAPTGTVSQVAKPEVKAEVKLEEKVAPKYKSEDYNGAPIVKLRLKQEGIMQYDHAYGLKLDSTTPVEMPLTPFFAERIGRTIELCV